jgi:hypothetical protein
MAGKLKQLEYQFYHNLEILGAGEPYTATNGNQRYATSICKCLLCGVIKTMRNSSIRAGRTQSCGCSHDEIVSKYKYSILCPDLFSIWRNMIARCYDPANLKFNDYGGRGIEVCRYWHNFDNFAVDVYPKPSATHSLDRYPNNNGNYDRTNWRWATSTEQGNNKRNNVNLTIDNKTQTVSQWSRETGINGETISNRLKSGLSHEQAVFKGYK